MKLRIFSSIVDDVKTECQCDLLNHIGQVTLSCTLSVYSAHDKELFVKFNSEECLGFYFNMLNELKYNKDLIINALLTGVGDTELVNESDKPKPKRILKTFDNFNTTILESAQVEDILKAVWYLKRKNADEDEIIVDISKLTELKQNEINYIFKNVELNEFNLLDYVGLPTVPPGKKHYWHETSFYVGDE